MKHPGNLGLCLEVGALSAKVDGIAMGIVPSASPKAWLLAKTPAAQYSGEENGRGVIVRVRHFFF